MAKNKSEGSDGENGNALGGMMRGTSRAWLVIGGAIVTISYAILLVGLPPIRLVGLLDWGFEPLEIAFTFLLTSPIALLTAVYLGAAFEQLYGQMGAETNQ